MVNARQFPVIEDKRDGLFRALSDRSRRRILRELCLGPSSVSDLAFKLEDPTRVNYHLRVLKQVGVVTSAQDRLRRVTYSLELVKLREVKQFVDDVFAEADGFPPRT